MALYPSLLPSLFRWCFLFFSFFAFVSVCFPFLPFPLCFSPPFCCPLTVTGPSIRSARRSPSAAPLHPGSGMVFRSVFKPRSTLLRQFCPSTRLSPLFAGLPASSRRRPRPVLPSTRRRVVHTRRSVVLTRRSVRLCCFSPAVAAGCRRFCFVSVCSFVFLLLFVLGLCLLVFYCLDLEAEAFVLILGLVPLYISVLISDFDSAFPAPTSVRWLLLVFRGGSDRLALFCNLLAFETASCGPLRGPGHLFVPFPTVCIYCCTVTFRFGTVVGEPTPISILGSSTLSSFRIKSGKDPPL